MLVSGNLDPERWRCLNRLVKPLCFVGVTAETENHVQTTSLNVNYKRTQISFVLFYLSMFLQWEGFVVLTGQKNYIKKIKQQCF